MDETTNFGFEHLPTKTERFWRWLGFRYQLLELPETELPGWMMTKTVIHFDLGDRVRLLLTGRLTIHTRHATDVQVDKCISAASFEIARPGESHD